MLGPDDECQRETTVLNRLLRWTQDAIEYEPDRRHADLIVQGMNVEDARTLSTTGVSEGSEGIKKRDESPELPPQEATAYRALAARLNYLALDRIDVQYAAKNITKHMAAPRQYDWEALRHVARYLKRKQRCVC